MNNQKTGKQNTADSSLFKILNFRNSIHRTSLRFTYLEHLKQRYARELLLIHADTLSNPKLVNDIRKHHEANVGKKITNTEKPTVATETPSATGTPEVTDTPETSETPTQKKNNFFNKQFNHQSNVDEKITNAEEPAGNTETPEVTETPETTETSETPETTMRRKRNIFKDFFKMYTEPKKEEVEEEEEEKEVDGFVWVLDPLEEELKRELKKKKNSLKWKIRKYFLQNPEKDEEMKPQDDTSDYMADDFVVIEPEPPKELHAESKFKERFIDFTAGSLAGIAQVYVSQPLDTVKVKLQTYPMLYQGMFNCFMQTYRHHGVYRGLYAGTVPAVVASVAENSVLFTAYSSFQNLITFVMEIDKVCELSVLANACAGSMAAVFSTLALCPTELVKCKLQAIQEMKEYLVKDSKVVPITAYKLTKDIYLREGISGFYRGLTSTFVREIPGVFIFFGSYEATREYLREPGQTKDEIGALKTMCAGAVGGITLWTLTFPADVIKSRTQIYNLKGTMLSVALHILRKEGILAFYRGLLPSIIKTIPATGTLFLVYEYVKKTLNVQLNSETEIE